MSAVVQSKARSSKQIELNRKLNSRSSINKTDILVSFEDIVWVSAKVTNADYLFLRDALKSMQSMLSLRVYVLIVVDRHKYWVFEESLPIIALFRYLSPLLVVSMLGSLQEHREFFGIHLRSKK